MIEVLFFAVTREHVGHSSIELDAMDGATLGTCISHVMALYPTLKPLKPYIRFALNETFCSDLSTPLADGDVVAFIPPVSGGLEVPVLTNDPIDRERIESCVLGDDAGALVCFTGRVRNHTGAHAVMHLDYEAYGSMAIKTLTAIRVSVEEAFPEVRIALQHRLGRLGIGEVAVFIAVASPHRAAAFEACQSLIDRLKKDVPIFKKESRGDGSIWVGLGP